MSPRLVVEAWAPVGCEVGEPVEVRLPGGGSVRVTAPVSGPSKFRVLVEKEHGKTTKEPVDEALVLERELEESSDEEDVGSTTVPLRSVLRDEARMPYLLDAAQGFLVGGTAAKTATTSKESELCQSLIFVWLECEAHRQTPHLAAHERAVFETYVLAGAPKCIAPEETVRSPTLQRQRQWRQLVNACDNLRHKHSLPWRPSLNALSELQVAAEAVLKLTLYDKKFARTDAYAKMLRDAPRRRQRDADNNTAVRTDTKTVPTLQDVASDPVLRRYARAYLETTPTGAEALRWWRKLNGRALLLCDRLLSSENYVFREREDGRFCALQCRAELRGAAHKLCVRPPAALQHSHRASSSPVRVARNGSSPEKQKKKNGGVTASSSSQQGSGGKKQTPLLDELADLLRRDKKAFDLDTAARKYREVLGRAEVVLRTHLERECWPAFVESTFYGEFRVERSDSFLATPRVKLDAACKTAVDRAARLPWNPALVWTPSTDALEPLCPQQENDDDGATLAPGGSIPPPLRAAANTEDRLVLAVDSAHHFEELDEDIPEASSRENSDELASLFDPDSDDDENPAERRGGDSARYETGALYVVDDRKVTRVPVPLSVDSDALDAALVAFSTDRLADVVCGLLCEAPIEVADLGEARLAAVLAARLPGTNTVKYPPKFTLKRADAAPPTTTTRSDSLYDDGGVCLPGDEDRFDKSDDENDDDDADPAGKWTKKHRQRWIMTPGRPRAADASSPRPCISTPSSSATLSTNRLEIAAPERAAARLSRRVRAAKIRALKAVDAAADDTEWRRPLFDRDRQVLPKQRFFGGGTSAGCSDADESDAAGRDYDDFDDSSDDDDLQPALSALFNPEDQPGDFQEDAPLEPGVALDDDDWDRFCKRLARPSPDPGLAALVGRPSRALDKFLDDVFHKPLRAFAHRHDDPGCAGVAVFRLDAYLRAVGARSRDDRASENNDRCPRRVALFHHCLLSSRRFSEALLDHCFANRAGQLRPGASLTPASSRGLPPSRAASSASTSRPGS